MIVSCCISSLLSASENDNKPFGVNLTRGVYAEYYGKCVVSVKKNVITYPIFVFDHRQEKSVWLEYGKPVRAMSWDDKEVLHIDLADGSRRTHSLKD